MKKVKLHRKEILFIFVLLNILYFIKKNKQKIPYEDSVTTEEEYEDSVTTEEEHEDNVTTEEEYENNVTTKKESNNLLVYLYIFIICWAFFLCSNIFIYYLKGELSFEIERNFVYYVFYSVTKFMFFNKIFREFFFYMNNRKENSSPEDTKQFLELIIDEFIKLFQRNLQLMTTNKILDVIIYEGIYYVFLVKGQLDEISKLVKKMIGVIVLYFVIQKFVFYLGVKLKEKISYDDPEKNKNKLIFCAVISVCLILKFIYENIYIQFKYFKDNNTFRIPDKKQIEWNKKKFQQFLNQNNHSFDEKNIYGDNTPVYQQEYLDLYQKYASINDLTLPPMLKGKHTTNKFMAYINDLKGKHATNKFMASINDLKGKHTTNKFMASDQEKEPLPDQSELQNDFPNKEFLEFIQKHATNESVSPDQVKELLDFLKFLDK